MDAQIALRHLAQAGEHHVDRRGDGAQQEEAADAGQHDGDDGDDDGRHDDAIIGGDSAIVRLARTGDAALLVSGDQLREFDILLQRRALQVGERLVRLALRDQGVHVLVRRTVRIPCLALFLQDRAILRLSVGRRVDDGREHLLVLFERRVHPLLQLRQLLVRLRALRRILRHGADDGDPALRASGVRQLCHGGDVDRPAHEVVDRAVHRTPRIAGVDAEGEEHHDEYGKTHDDLLRYGDSVHFFPSFLLPPIPKPCGRASSFSSRGAPCR